VQRLAWILVAARHAVEHRRLFGAHHDSLV
jgi:hypothetical protein